MIDRLSSSIFEIMNIDSKRHRYRFFIIEDNEHYYLRFGTQLYKNKYSSYFLNNMKNLDKCQLLKFIYKNWGYKEDGYSDYLQEWLYNRNFEFLNDKDIGFYHKLSNIIVKYYYKQRFQDNIKKWLLQPSTKINWESICLENYFEIMFVIYKILEPSYNNSVKEISIYMDQRKYKVCKNILQLILKEEDTI